MSENNFRAAASAVDVTPDLAKYKVPLHGYGARGPKPAEGVHDAIYAKILVMDNGDTCAAIITIDILQIDAALRADIINGAGVASLTNNNVVVTAAHGHSAPAALEPRTKSLPPMLKWYVEGYYEECVDAIARGLADAHANLAPANFAAHTMKLSGAVRNRRIDGYNYDTRAFTTPEQSGEIIDNEMAVLHFTDVDGGVIATLVNLAGHATVLGADNMLVSGDWPGAMQRSVEKRLGGVCLFANGAQGNVAPDCGAGDLSFKDVEDFGGRIATHVVESVKQITPSPPECFEVVTKSISLPAMLLNKYNPFVEAGMSEEFVVKFFGKIYPEKIEMTSIRLDGVGMVTVPGEMLTELSVDFKTRASEKGVATPLILGLANDSIGYIPSRGEYDKGGYEAGMCFYGPTLGSQLIDDALKGVISLFD